MASSIEITSLILAQLAVGEKRILGLVLGVRSSLGPDQKVKGDLTQIVKSSLRKLIASKEVADIDGMYALRSRKRRIQAGASRC